MKFQLGDVVQLRSGSPKMTVDEDPKNNGKYMCTWFDKEKNDFISRYLIAEILELAPKSSK